ERNRALGIFSSMSAIGFTTGVILGGILTSTLSWHWVFFVNVPIGIIVIIAGFLVLPNPSRDQKKRGFDVTGAVLVSTTLLTIVYAITQVSVPGESFIEIAILLLLSAVLGASFLIVERRAGVPLVPLDIFHRRTVIVSDLIMFLAFGANAALVFIITLFLQEGRGYSPIETGLIFVPAGLGGLSGATLAPRAIKRALAFGR
ncbi:MAG TPA: MFS transporter, partial [Methanotrichaceae archaeon]|nr:MFS transporter [Methanotrichaceae archaeon]